jgi:hypothetical protein
MEREGEDEEGVSANTGRERKGRMRKKERAIIQGERGKGEEEGETDNPGRQRKGRKGRRER